MCVRHVSINRILAVAAFDAEAATHPQCEWALKPDSNSLDEKTNETRQCNTSSFFIQRVKQIVTLKSILESSKLSFPIFFLTIHQADEN